jgi:hypothetical protein
MNDLRTAAQQALAFTMRDFATMRDFEAARAVLHDDLRAALKQEEEASAWLSERKEHWRKEREKMQATKDQDPELSAALGWPGGTSDPVLDRTRLLQMVAALRVASKQALEALESGLLIPHSAEVFTALRAALAQQDERDWSLLEATQESLREHMTEIHRLRAATPQLLAQRDALLEVLKSTGLFLHHCWCDVQMDDYSFEKLNRQMEIVDAALMAAEETK